VTGNLATYAKRSQVILKLIPQKSINVKTTVAVLADLKESLTALLPLMKVTLMKLGTMNLKRNMK
jgi:acetolactate synthase-1/2/3 large subunit